MHSEPAIRMVRPHADLTGVDGQQKPLSGMWAHEIAHCISFCKSNDSKMVHLEGAGAEQVVVSIEHVTLQLKQMQQSGQT